jgi:hypothetical protein
MNKPALLAGLLLTFIASTAGTQELEEVVVTGSRVEARHIPSTSIKRHADFMLLKVEVSNDSRDYNTRRAEIYATLRAMLDAAEKDKSIDLSVIRDDNVVLPLKLDDDTLDFGDSSGSDVLETTINVKIPIEQGTANGAALVEKLRKFISGIKPSGRTDLDAEDETQVSVVNIAQYRDAVIRLFAEDVKRVTTALGGDYRVVARGLDQPIQWVRDGTLDVVIFVPYEYDVLPTSVSSYIRVPND